MRDVDTNTNLRTRTQGQWIEAAIATHDGHCPDHPTQTTGPMFDWIEDDTVKGGWGGDECGQCGTPNSGWITSGARRVEVGGDMAEFERALRAEVQALRDEWAVNERVEIEARLSSGLVAAAKVVRAAGLDPFELDRNDFYGLSIASQGSEVEPGVWVDGGELRAWAPDPVHSGDVIEVLMRDVGATA